jgi:hypothetical protein
MPSLINIVLLADFPAGGCEHAVLFYNCILIVLKQSLNKDGCLLGCSTVYSGKLLPDYIALQPRRQLSLYSPL